MLEQFDPFRTQTVFEQHKAGGVAARPRQTIDEAGADWIAGDREHDRHRPGCLKHWPRSTAHGQDDIRRERDQFRRVFARVFDSACGPAIINPHVAAIDPALAFPKSAPPCAHAHARAREIIEEFPLGSVALPARPTVSRARRYRADHADIRAGLVGAAWSSVMALSISEPRLA